MNIQHNENARVQGETSATFFCFLIELHQYLSDSSGNPLPLRPYLHDIAVNLPADEQLTDRRLLEALSVYPMDSWWPPAWGVPPLDPYSFIHDGKRLALEADVLLEDLAQRFDLDLNTLPCEALDGLRANDAFVRLRLKLLEQWQQVPDSRPNVEEAYRQARWLAANHPTISSHEFQRRAVTIPIIDGRMLRQTLYSTAGSWRHLVHAGHEFIFCSRCGFRDPAEAHCRRGRCPGEEGWTRISYRDELLILHPEHVDRITIPATEELDLFEKLKTIVEPAGGRVVLWPALDRFDLYIDLPSIRIAVDVKDWEHPEQLARSIPSDILNAAPYLYDLGIYVYPAERGGDYGTTARERTKSRLANNRIMSTKSLMALVRKALRDDLQSA